MAQQESKQQQQKPLRFVTNYGAPHPKRRRIGAACLTCRRRKTACSGERPFCETCKQNKQECAGYTQESASTSIRPTSDSEEPDHVVPKRERRGEVKSPLADTPVTTLSTKRPSDDIGQVQISSHATSPKHDDDRAPESLFAGPRNRMPYFRWLGPTAIMPGFKQMVVKVKRQEPDVGRSSTDGGVGGAGILSPNINNINQPSDKRVPPIYSATPAAIESDVRTPLSLPFYDNSPMPPSELITHLAETFFTHLGCNYPFLQRERFMRDLAEKQVDAILVDAVCALAARFSTHSLLAQQTNGTEDSKATPAEYGHIFAQRAKSALMYTYTCPSVAAVQAALLLAYNEFGESRDSGLWMYLGISIRLAQDLGMHILEGLRFKGRSGPTPKMIKREAISSENSPFNVSKDPAPVRLTSGDEPMDDQPLKEIEEQMAAEQERVDTFWAVFFLDRVVSSGTGRRSTLRDKDIELSFPPLQETDPESDWPAPFPALIRIIHLYGRVTDLLNGIKEPCDITSETPKRLAAMESQVTHFYQNLSTKLHFNAVNFQHYVKAGQGTNFVLLHIWFHTLIILLHQPTLLKTFEGRMLQLFPNSQQLSMSSAKTIADILSYSQLIDAKACLGNPFTTQPIYIAACAFLKETIEQTASSNAQSRAPSLSPVTMEKDTDDGLNSSSSTRFTPSSLPISSLSGQQTSTTATTPPNAADRRSLAKHTLLATAASQHYQLCTKALQSIETYWAGTKYILTVLDQKFEGVGDPLLYTVEEGDAAMERPQKDVEFRTPGWRRKTNLSVNEWVNGDMGREAWLQVATRAGSEGPMDMGNAIGWTLTGTMDSPSTNLAWHYASEPSQVLDTTNPIPSNTASSVDHRNALRSPDDATRRPRHIRSSSSNPMAAPTNMTSFAMPIYRASSSGAVSHSDASLLLGLGSAYQTSTSKAAGTTSPPSGLPFTSPARIPHHTGQAATPPHQPHSIHSAAFQTPAFLANRGVGASPAPSDLTFPQQTSYGDMMIESQDVDMSMLGLDMMPWFDAGFPLPTSAGFSALFDGNTEAGEATGRNMGNGEQG